MSKGCILKSDPQYQNIVTIFGDNIASTLVNEFNKGVKGTEMYYPSVQTLTNWITKNKTEQIARVKELLIAEPGMTEKSIINLLSGIITKFENSYMVTRGNLFGAGLVNRAYHEKYTYGANLRLMRELAKEFPQHFEIIDGAKNSYTHVVKINPIKPEVSGEPKQSIGPDGQTSLFDYNVDPRTTEAQTKTRQKLQNLFENKTRVSAVDIIAKIKKNNPELRHLINKLEGLIPAGTEIILDDSNGYATPFGTANAKYNKVTQEISIAKNALFAQSPEAVILHELIHRITSEQLALDTNATKQFNELLSEVREKIGTNRFDYALQNKDEFLVAVLMDKEFGAALSKLEGVNKKISLFEEIINFILKVINIEKTDNAYDQAVSLVNSILEKVSSSTVDQGAIVKQGAGYKIYNKAVDANLSQDEIDEMFDNYVRLIDRKRKGFAITKQKFENLAFRNLALLEIGDSKILGEWDNKNNIFKGRVLSSKSIRTMYNDILSIKDSINFMASVPQDMGVMLAKAGFVKAGPAKPFTFERRDDNNKVIASEVMEKSLYFSNKEIAKKVFNKSLDTITLEEVVAYDTYFNKVAILTELINNIRLKKPINTISKSLKELSIYDYNAYKIVKKYNKYFENSNSQKINKVFVFYTDLLKNNYYKTLNNEQIESSVKAAEDAKLINKTEAEELLEIVTVLNNLLITIEMAAANKDVQIDTLTAPKVYNELNNELNKTLVQYLDKFGFSFKSIEDLQSKLGIDSFATHDILNKIIQFDKDNQTELPEKASEVIVYMMQYNPIITEIMGYMDKKSMFRDGVISKEDKLKAIADLLNEQLHLKTKTSLPESLIQKLKLLVQQFLNMLSKPMLNRVNRKVGEIAEQVLLQNQALITASLYKPGAFGQKTKQVSLKEAMDKDEFGAKIINNLSPKGFILTGSTSLGEQGVISRPSENLLHDIDWVSPFNRKKTKALFLNSYPDALFIRDIYSEKYITDSWLIAPENHRITDYNSIVTESGKIIIDSYNVRDTQNEIVGTYKLEEGKEIIEGVEGKVIDFFTYENYNQQEPVIVDNIRLTHWTDIFKAKLEFARYKDIWDYNRFIPKEVVNEDDSILYNVDKPYKEGVKEVFKTAPELARIGTPEQYSQYLDTIFPQSGVKDIVYHGTGFPDTVTKFKGRTYFSNLYIASEYAAWDERMRQEYAFSEGKPDVKSKAQVIPAVINLTNPIYLDKVNFKETEKEYPGHDGIYAENTIDPLTGNELQIVVFDSKNTHVLGSPQDIEGFKDFVSKDVNATIENLETEILSNPETIFVVEADQAGNIYTEETGVTKLKAYPNVVTIITAKDFNSTESLTAAEQDSLKEDLENSLDLLEEIVTDDTDVKFVSKNMGQGLDAINSNFKDYLKARLETEQGITSKESSVDQINQIEEEDAITVDPKETENKQETLEERLNPKKQETRRSTAFLMDAVKMLMDNLGMPESSVQFISANEAMSITRNAKNPYNGQPAFFYNGVVYFVDGQIDFRTALHEISHPFIKSIRYQNPTLFNELYDTITTSELGKQVIAQALADYNANFNTAADRTEEINDDVREEVIVRFLTEALEQIVSEEGLGVTSSVKEQTLIQKIIQKIMFALKKMFRQVFGRTLKIEKLSPTTSIKELANLLVSEKFKVNMDIVSQTDVVDYINNVNKINEQLRDTILNTKDKGKIALLTAVGDTAQMYKSLLNTLKENNDIEGLAMTLEQNWDGQTLITDLQKTGREINKDKLTVLTKLAEEENALDEVTRVGQNIVTIIAGQERALDNIKGRLDYLKDQKVTNDKKLITELNTYRDHVKHIQEFIDNFDKIADEIGISENDEIRKEMSNLLKKTNYRLKSINDIHEKIVLPVLKDTWDMFMGGTIAELKEQKKKLEEALLKDGAYKSAIERSLKNINAKLDKADLNLDAFKEYAYGKRGDINPISSWMESYIAQQDPTISSFAAYVKMELSEAQNAEYNRFNTLRNKLDKLEKQLGLNPADINGYANEFLTEDVVKVKNDEGELVDFEVYAILNPFKNTENTMRAMYSRIQDIRDAAENQTPGALKELEELEAKLKLHKALFWNNEMVDDYYFIDMLLLNAEDVDGAALLEIISEKQKEIRHLHAQRNFAENELEVKQLYDEIKQKRYEIREFYSDYNNGVKKDEQGLKDAKALREWRESKNKYYELILKKNDFEKALSGFEQITIAKLQADGYTQDEIADQLIDAKAQWIKENTRVVINQDFYDTKSNILTELNAVNEEIENFLQKDKTLADVVGSAVLYNGKLYKVSYTDGTYILSKENEQDVEIEEDADALLSDLNMRIPTKKAFDTQREYIFQSLMGKKDENGEYRVTELSEEHIALIKKMQEEMEENKNLLVNNSGLSQSESRELQDFFEKRKLAQKLTTKENSRFKSLLAKKKDFKIPAVLKNKLSIYTKMLAELQSKEATSYYLDTVNDTFYDLLNLHNLLDGQDFDLTIAETILSVPIAEALMESDPKFKEWFEKNHYLAEVYVDEETGYEQRYQRIEPWNKVIPNDTSYYESFEITNADGSTEIIQGLPSIDFYNREVRDEYKLGYDPQTKKVDNSSFKDQAGRYKPKDKDQMEEMRSKYGEYFQQSEQAWDHYLNLEYYKVMEEGGPKAEILKTIIEYHEGSQEGLDPNQMIGMYLPRFRADLYQNLTADDRANFTERMAEVWENTRAKFGLRVEDYEDGFNFVESVYAADKIVYRTDSEKIPIQGKYLLEKKQVSRDVFASLGAYALSAAENKKLKKANHMGRFLQDIAKANTPADITKTIKKSSLSGQLAQNAVNKMKSSKVILSGSENFRSDTIDAMIETNFEGRQMNSDAPVWQQIVKFTKPLTALGSFSFFAFDLQSAAKNYLGAHAMVGLEAINSRFFSYRSHIQALPWAHGAMKDLGMEIYETGANSLKVQMLMAFDAFQGRFEEKFATNPGRKLTRDIVNMSWTSNTRQYLEITTNVETLASMLYHVKVEQTLDNGEVKTIKYVDAFELDETTKTLKLKKGIDPKYDVNGEEFNKVKLAAQEHNNFAQGVYAKFDKTRLERTVIGGMTIRMKKFFVKMAINRFALEERTNIATGRVESGFHIKALKTYKRLVQGGLKEYAYLQADEKKAVLQSMIDLFKGYVLYELILLGLMLGFDFDDEDKYNKMKERSGALPTPFTSEEDSEGFNLKGWFLNNLTLLLLNTHEEISFFNPLKGEVMMGTLANWSPVTEGSAANSLFSIIKDVKDLATFQGLDVYGRDVGALNVQKSNEYKIWLKLYKLVGLKGKMIDPVTATRNKMNMRKLTTSNKKQEVADDSDDFDDFDE